MGEVEAVGRAVGRGSVREETGRGFEGAFGTEEEGAEGDFVGVVDVGTGEAAGALACEVRGG